MSEEQLKAFLEAVKADAGLREKLRSASDPEAVVAIAMEAGFAISLEQLMRARQVVSDRQLEGVAGGGHNDAETNILLRDSGVGCEAYLVAPQIACNVLG